MVEPAPEATERIDLHTHTTWSSGFSEPAELVRLASREEVTTLAITDHHSIDGYVAALPVADRLRMQLVPAIELDCRSGERRVDLLGYWFDPANSQLREFLQRYPGSVRALAADRAFMHAVFAARNLTYDEGALHTFAGTASPTYPVVVEYLVAVGWGDSVGAVFRALKELSLAGALPRVKRQDPSVEQAAEVLRAAGGVVSLAHPALVRNDEVVRRVAASGAVDAIETPYTGYWTDGGEKNKRYAALAREFGLPVSAGSDFHAYPHDGGKLGVTVAGSVLADLRSSRPG